MIKWHAGVCDDPKLLIKTLVLRSVESCDQACIEDDTQTCVDFSIGVDRDPENLQDVGLCRLYKAGCLSKSHLGHDFYSSSPRVYPSKI